MRFEPHEPVVYICDGNSEAVDIGIVVRKVRNTKGLYEVFFHKASAPFITPERNLRKIANLRELSIRIV